MRRFARNTLFAAASLVMTAGIVGFSDQAFATAGAPRVTVRYDARSIATPDGRSALDRRIRSAAMRVCETSNAGASFETLRCRADAVEQAEARLDHQLALAATPVQIALR